MKQKPVFKDNKKKCKHCKGKGIVQIAPNIRGLMNCPFCKGSGRTN